MAGVGKKILSLFVEYDEEAEQKANESEKPAVQAEAEAVRPNPVVQSAGVSDEAIAANIAAALEKANLEGFDYFEYAKTIDALKVTIPAEQTLFQTAFASGSVMGATKKTLLESARHYLHVLENESGKFAETVEARLAATVTGRETQLQEIDQHIARKAEQINQLTDEINRLTVRKNALTNELSENRIQIEKVRNDFAATMRIFTVKIGSDIEKIEKYIAG